MFDILNTLEKYLHSIRNLNQNDKHLLAFDMRFPNKWDIKKYLDKDFKNFTAQKEFENVKIYTFYSNYNKTEVDNNYNMILRIINGCLEEEKKKELLDKKIQELKSKFDVLSVEELERLNFDVNHEDGKPEICASEGTGVNGEGN